MCPGRNWHLYVSQHCDSPHGKGVQGKFGEDILRIVVDREYRLSTKWLPGIWIGTSWVSVSMVCDTTSVTDDDSSDGYEFLMQNCRFYCVPILIQYTFRRFIYTDKAGDRICIFGFSRGAYTARALAGMIHKVCVTFPNLIFVLTSPSGCLLGGIASCVQSSAGPVCIQNV